MTALVARGPILSVYKNRMSRTTSPAVIELFADAGLLGEAFREAAPLRLLGETDERGAILVGERDAAPDLYLNMTFSTLRNRICRASCLREEQATTKSVGVVLDGTGDVYERITYDAYGQARHRFAADCDGNGQYDNNDNSGFFTNGTTIDDTLAYHADFDVNCDGAINVVDIGILAGSSPVAMPDGWIGEPDSTTGPDNSIGYAGYVFNHEREDYTVRFRNYNPELGRWMQRDPIGYNAGVHIYEYVHGNPMLLVDPFGLDPIEPKDPRSSDEQLENVCAALKDAIDNNMTYEQMINKYVNGSGPGPFYQTHLKVPTILLTNPEDYKFRNEFDSDRKWEFANGYGTSDIDSDWMVVVSWHKFNAWYFYFDDEMAIYNSGKFWWILTTNQDFGRYYGTGEANAVDLARLLRKGKVSMPMLYDALNCDDVLAKKCPAKSKDKEGDRDRRGDNGRIR